MRLTNKKILGALALTLVWGAIAEESKKPSETQTWDQAFPDATASLGACVVARRADWCDACLAGCGCVSSRLVGCPFGSSVG